MVNGTIFDCMYLIPILPAVVLAGWGSVRGNAAFSRYQGQLPRRHITGTQMSGLQHLVHFLAGMKRYSEYSLYFG